MAEALKNVIAQSLECPVCLNTFTDPKILSCSHTYCKTCLDNLLDCHGNDQMLRCPVCRADMEHKDDGHRVIEAAVYESSHLKSIEDLKSKADKKRSCFQKYVDFIDEQKDRVSNVQKQCTDDINKAYEESVRQLTEKKEILIDEVKGRSEGVEKELDEMKKLAEKHITHLTALADVVTNRTKIPLDMDALAAHDTLCQDLQEALKQEDPDYKQPIQSSKKGKSVTFNRNVGMGELTLGKIVHAIAKNIALPTNYRITYMVSTPDGRMAVGCHTGGIEIYSADGQLKQTVFKHVGIRGIGFLSDDRYVILDDSHKITLYTLEYTKLNVRFETLGYDEGGVATLTVDGDDQIYVSYMQAQKILVFSPAGGKAIREIPCGGYDVEQITSYNDYIMITASDLTLRLIDKQGVVKYKLTELGYFPYAAVSQWNTILIANLKHEGLVSIDEYTNELKHVQSLVIDYKIEKPDLTWYSLRQYRSGEIALCTPDRLYIFH